MDRQIDRPTLSSRTVTERPRAGASSSPPALGAAILPPEPVRLFLGACRFAARPLHVVVLICVVRATIGFAGIDRGPADRFVTAVSVDTKVPAEAAELLRTQWSACRDCDPEEFLAQGLAVFSPPFREGLDAYDADDHLACAQRMESLSHDANPFVAVNAAAYEIKALVGLDRLIEAAERIGELSGDGGARLAAYSYFAPEMGFLRGYCLLGDLRFEEADHALRAFLADFPDAPSRLALSARQILLELSNREPEMMGEVVDLMQYSGRRLKNADAGETVQQRQQRVLELLDKMIKEAEDREKNACSSGSSGSSGGQSKSGQAPQSPMQDSSLPSGNPEPGMLRSGRRVNPGETWGAMPPAERERDLQALRESFPKRYRRLDEQYYEELAKKP